MTTEEELIDLRKRLEESEKVRLREMRKAAFVFGTLATVFLIALVYFFFQEAKSNMQIVIAERNKVVAEELAAVMKKQILVEMEKSAACERSLAALQSSNAKSGK